MMRVANRSPAWTCACSIVLLFLVTACGPSRPATTPSTGAPSVVPVVDTDRFPHDKHTSTVRNAEGRALGCADCHDAGAVREGRLARPGTNQHAPCDDCHKAEFGKPPGALCKVCHVSVDPFRKGSSPLQMYPERGATKSLASTFSHRMHLDKGAMERATGAHVACSDCHARDAQSRDPMVPGHLACARCHENAPRVKAKLPMDNCAGCHPQRDVALTRGRRFITGDLRFAHATHEVDRAGAPVACVTCHVNVDEAGTREAMAIPPMVRCAQCHEDSARSPDRVRMSNCSVCHAQVSSDSPPASHGTGMSTGGTRPDDHTLEFRKHHADQAAAPDSKCRFCHTELSGAREDSCFQCHEVMRPRDHNLIFRTDHGREAQTDSSRCASCHTPETCVACHSVPPRSHTPLGEFRLGGHAEQARFGLTACLTCHTYQDTCAKCHRGTR